MECFSILCLAVSDTEAVFDVIYGALDGCADLIGGLPFLCSADRSGIKAEVFLRIKVDHASTAGSGARITAMTDAAVFSIFTFVPTHFGAYELEGLQTAAQMRSASFRLHGKGQIMGTAGYPFFIDRVSSRQTRRCIRSGILIPLREKCSKTDSTYYI